MKKSIWYRALSWMLTVMLVLGSGLSDLVVYASDIDLNQVIMEEANLSEEHDNVDDSKVPAVLSLKDTTTTTVANGKLSMSSTDSGGTWERISDTEIYGTTSKKKGTTYTSTLVLTNTTSAALEVTFNISLGDAKQCEIDSVKASDTNYTKIIAANSTIEFKLKSTPGIKVMSFYISDAKSDSVTISNISAVEAQEKKTVAIISGDGGSVNIPGEYTETLGTVKKLEATASVGYEFAAWVDENQKVLSTDAKYDHPWNVDGTVKAVFVPKGTPVYMLRTSKIFYADLDSAITAAQSDSDPTVVLIKSGTISNGTYTIPSGVTLLLPYASGATTINSSSDDHNHKYANNTTISASKSMATPGDNKTVLSLTFGDNVIINVKGALVAGGQITGSSGGGPAGQTGGNHSDIILNGTMVIDGGRLSTCGYITGNGSITAKNGSEIYAPFVIGDFNGGTYTDVAFNGQGISPFNVYSMPNIQVTMELTGSSVYGYCNLYAGSQHNMTTSKVVGNVTDALLNYGTSVSFTYDPNKTIASQAAKVGKTNIVIYGGGSIGSLKLKVKMTDGILGNLAQVTVSTSDALFPIPYNYNITCVDGTFNVANMLKIMPGAEVTIKEDATLNVSSQLAIYDGGGFRQYAAPKYPTAQELENVGYSERGRLIVEGTLNVTGTLAGWIETQNGNGKIVLGSEADTSLDLKDGVKAADKGKIATVPENYNNQVTRTLNAWGMSKDSEGTLVCTPLVAGSAYYGTKAETPISSYTYTIVDYNVKDSKVDTAETTIEYNGTEDILGRWETLYTVYWKSDNELVDVIACEPTKNVCAPTSAGTVIKTGYALIGWKDTATGTVYEPSSYDGTTAVFVMPQRDVTLEAQWTPKTYTVTYNPNGGTGEMPAQELIYDAEESLSENVFTRVGYKFIGWNTQADGSGVSCSDGANKPNLNNGENVTLYAIWEPIEYSITYDYNGGTLDESAIVVDSYTIEDNIELPTPTKTGYTFIGWLKKTEDNVAQASGDYITDIQPGNMGNLKLIAQWKPNTYTVRFNANSGSGTMADQQLTYDDTNQHLSANSFIREGYIFKGWALSENGEVAFVDQQTTPNVTAEANGTVTLYAVWEEQQLTIQVNLNGGYVLDDAGSQLTTIEHFVVGYKDKISSTLLQNAPKRFGYTFSGWLNSTTGVLDSHDMLVNTEHTKDTKYTAQWQANTITIAFDANNGDGHMNSVQYTFGTENKVSLTENNFTHTYYYFSGWNTAADGSGTAYADKAQINDSNAPGENGTITLYAQWKPASFSLEFKVGNETYGESISVAHGTKITFPTHPTKTGYTFAGWNTKEDGTGIAYGTGDGENSTMPTNSLTLYAQWTVNAYNVNWYIGGSEAENIVKTEAAAYGTIIPEYTGYGTKTGHEFSGWYTQADFADDSKITSFADIRMPAEDVNYYGKWNILSYKITFDSQGGSEVEAITEEYGKEVTAPQEPTKTGYTFAGWYKDENGTSEVIFPVKVDAENVTFYAKWIPKQYTITFVTNGGTEINPITRDFGAGVSAPNNPEKEGYTFTGWYTDSACTEENKVEQLPSIMPAEDKTYYAGWTINQYTITFDTDGGSKIEAITQNYNTVVTAPNDPTKTGYTFVGWLDSKGDAAEVPGTMPAGDITLKANWTVNQYTITFDTDGGSEVATITQNYNTSVTAPDNPTKEGYTFAGWVDSEGNETSIPTTMPAEHVTLKAKWTINKYKIVFDSVGGTDIEVVEKNYGESVAEPETPTKTGYTFGGWYEDASYSGNKVEFPITVGATDVTYYAKWSKNSYAVHWNVDGEEYTTTSVAYLDSVIAPTTPAKTGYTFDGWYSDSGYTNKATNFGTMGTSELTYYGKWTINQYTITFANTGDTVIDAITQDYATEVNAPSDPTKSGYTFSGWDKEIPATMPAEDVTITAQWSINQYTITFNTDGGSEVSAITQDYATAVTAPGNPTKIGYTFAGWDKEIPATVPAEDVTITAQWTINQYTITFENTGDVEMNPITQDYASAVNTPDDPTKNGYTFVGWDKEIPAIMPAEDMTITASWTANTYAVTFDANGGSCDEASRVVTFDQTYGSAEKPLPVLTREGYTFEGWYLSDVKIADATTVKITSDITLVAKWSVGSAYSITYNLDGGELGEDAVHQYNVETPTFRLSSPVREGYTFVGWTGSNGDTPATTVTIEKGTTGALSYTANWSINSYQLTWDVDGVTTDGGTLQYGTEISAPEEPIKEGHTFAGWKNSAGQMVTFPTKMPARDEVFIAQWTVNSYKVTWVIEDSSTEETYLYGATLNVPNVPAKTGYTFSGWSSTVPDTMGAADVTYTAQYTINQYTITFDTDGGSEVAAITQDYATGISTPSVPTKEGYTFIGWSPVVPETMPAENVTIKATWKINQYKVTWDIDGAKSEVTYDYGAVINVPTSPTKEGYTFVGWSPEVDSTMPAQDMTYTATWKANEYTVTWNVDGTVSNEKYEYGQAITAPVNPAKKGYTFVGWSPTVDATMPAKDVTYTATWTINQYTITFEDVDGKVLNTIKQDFATRVSAPSDPTKPGYTFAGWNQTIPDTMPAENITITAQWTANSYKVIFEGNGSTDGSMADMGITYGETAKKLTECGFTRIGYTFAGWNTQADGKGTAYAAEENIENLLADLTLYAQWTINQYTITFVTSGGSEIAAITQDYASAVTKPQDPTKTGYTFAGWYEDEEGMNPSELPTSMPAEDKTYYAGWTINQYTISFITNGGNSVDAITQDYTSTLTKPQDPTKTGYTFTGWYADEQCTNRVEIPTNMPAENKTYYAGWVINTYTITFITNGGSAITPITQNYNSAITAPEEPTKIGHTFLGWYTDEACAEGNEATLPAIMPAEDKTYYAGWKINQYTIAFESNGGTEISAITQDYDTEVSEPTVPIKTGYTFVGWYADEGCTVAVSFPVKMPVEGTTYYAKWTPIYYKLTWILGNGNDSVVHQYIYEANVSFIQDPTRTGYNFAGWVDDQDKEVISLQMPAEDITIKASWKPVKYMVQYELSEGRWPEGIEPATEYNIESESYVLPVPVREGYTFAGWTGSNGTMPNTTVTIATGTTGDKSYTATWTPVAYDIQYNLNGGIGLENPKATYTVEETFELMKPTKAGYTFAGWLKAGEVTPIWSVDVGTMGMLELTAQWTANTYTVTFVGNSNTAGSMDSMSVTYAEEAKALNECRFTRTGYTFVGWNTKADGSGIAYEEGTKISDLLANLTLYAQWKPNTYTVAFEANGGSGTMENMSFTYGTAQQLSANTFVMEGYSFNGWKIKDTNTVYSDKQSVSNLTTEAGESVTLVAQWKVNAYTITFVQGNGQADIVRTQNYGTAITVPSDPSWKGYRFEGWDTEVPETMPAENTTITATWTSYLDLLKKIDTQSFIQAETNAEHEAVLNVARGYYAQLNDEQIAEYAGSEHQKIFFEVIKNISVRDMKLAVLAAEDATNATLQHEDYGQIAKLDVYDDLSVDVMFIRPDFPAMGMLSINFLQELFKYNEIYGVTINGTSTCEGASFTQFDIMLAMAYETMGRELEMTKDEFTSYLQANKDTISIADLDGYAVNAAVKAKTPEGIEYTVGYEISFFSQAHDVTWVQNNGKENIVVSTKYLDTITAPEVTYEGYNFRNWYADKNCSVSAVLPATMGKEPVTYYAAWDINTYTITFNTNGGNEIADIVAEYNTAISKPANPTKTGYTFLGWYSDEACATENKVEIPAVMPAENVTYYAGWAVNPHTITYVANGVETVENYDYGNQVTGPIEPIREGYSFAGWYEDENCTVKATLPETMPDKDLMYYAGWTVNQYTISFDTNGGSAVDDITADYGTTVNAPSAPTKEGHTFAGWYSDKTCGEESKVEISATMPAKDVTYYAGWTVNQYTITFDTNGGSAVNDITADYGAEIKPPVDPEKTGYTFAGWYSDKACGEESKVEIAVTMPAKNVTYFAGWTANTYTVTLDANGGSLTGGNMVSVVYESQFQLPTPTRSGYTFVGWYLNGVKVSNTDLVKITDNNQILTAKWQVGESYPIRYELAEGIWETGTVVPEFYNVVTESFDLPTPVREGYTFNGWTGSNGTEAQTVVTVEKGTTGDLHYVANWTINQYTITFDTDGGSEVAAITADYGTVVSAPADPIKEGYTFTGWVDAKGNAIKVPAMMPADDMTITATWKLNQYTIMFDSAGGSTLPAIKADYGTTVMAPTDPTRTGYTFAGWVDSAGDAIEVPAVMPAGDMTITATWTINQYTITFDSAGGGEVAAITADYGTAVTTPADPTRTGYTFAGWDKTIPATIPASNMTITAKWTVNSYTISFDSAGGSKVANITEEYGAVVTMPEEPVREGYTFQYWTPEIPEIMPAEDITVKAVWSINQYEITFDSAGGSAVEKIAADYGTSIQAPAEPTREGYTFTGWKDSDGDTVTFPLAIPGSNLALTAQWKINDYTVMYKVDGEVYKTYTVSYGNEITLEEAPAKLGYTFSGWSMIPTTMPAENVEITGSFTANVYEVSFDAGYADSAAIEKRNVTFDEAYGMLPVLERVGYVFNGWYLKDTSITDQTLVKTAAAHTITASWIPKTYTVTLDANGGICDVAQITVTYDGTYAELPTPTWEGYDFVGWFDGDVQISTETRVVITEEQNLVAHWNASGDTPYTVYHYQQTLNGDYELIKTELLNGATNAVVQATQMNSTGFKFNADLSMANGVIEADGSLELVLYYDRETYTVVWNIASQEIRESYCYGAVLVVPNTDRAEDEHAAYIFTGWNVELPEMVTESAVFTAQYELSYEAVIGEITYRTLKVALEQAKKGDMVTLVQNTVITEDVTVPEGVILLLPCMDDDIGYVLRNNGKLLFNPDGTNKAGSVGVGPDAYLYRKLTVAEGVTITVNGTVLVNAVTGRPSSGHSDQDITGGYAQIDLDGNIIVENGGILDCFGYIKGDGMVTAKSGSRVGDLYIVRNWRGGTQGLKMYEANVYPMNEYDCHNIETDIRVESGATYEGLVKMYAGSQYNYTRYPQVDNKNGLIRLNEGAYLIRSYEDDREVFRISGGADFASSTLEIVGVDLTTAEFIYPFDGDIDFELYNGRYDFINDYKFMPGGSATVASDAELYVNEGITVVFYQEFDDLANTGNTEYPEREPAVLYIANGARFTNAGIFAGHIYTETPNILIGSNPVWDVVTREANGYCTDAINRGEETWIPINHTLSITRPGHTWSYGINQSIVWDDTADYSAVQQALSMVPEDLDYYVPESTTGIQAALDQVVYGLPIERQEEVDAMAQPILDAVAALQLRKIIIYFNTNGGTLTDTALEVECIGSYGKLPIPVKDYYAFQGWYDVDGDRVYNNDEFKSKTDITLNAQWRLKDADYKAVRKAKQKVPSDMSMYTEQSVAAVEAAVEAVDYSLTADRQAEVEAMAQAILDAVAALEFRKVTVYLNANGGLLAADSIEVSYTQKIGQLPEPTRIGYTFDGWYTEENVLVSEQMVIDTLDARIITAKWSINSYTITFNSAGGNEVAAITAAYGTEIDVPTNPTREGYTFTGWDQEIPETMPAGNMTITAKWKINSYTITFDSAGGSENATITAEYGTRIETPGNPTREGHTFTGWDQEIPETMPAGNMIITAKWKINSYTITFDSVGGSENVTITAEYGTRIETPVNPTREGYSFTGWDKEVPETMPAENITIIAKWSAQVYTMTLDAAGGLLSNDNTISVTYDSQYDLPIPSREGYVFIGWYLGDKKVENTDIVKVTDNNQILVAQWRIGKHNQITYTLDGGLWETGTVVPENYTIETESFMLPIPVKAEHIFLGWTGSNGTTPQTSVMIEKGTMGDLNFIANWAPYYEIIEQQDGTIDVIVYDYAPMDSLTLNVAEVLSTVKDYDDATEIRVTIPDGFELKLYLSTEKQHYGNVVMVEDTVGNYTVVKETVITDDGVAIKATQSQTMRVVENSLIFPDIPVGFWAYDGVAYMSSRGLLLGKLDGNFAPTEAIQRRTVALMLYRLEGEPDVEDVQVFPDVPTGTRYSKAIAWAQSVGVINGYNDGSFRPTDIISRQHLAAMLYRYAQYKEMELPQVTTGNITSFNDYGTIYTWARESAQWAYSVGVINGRANNYFDPLGNASRAQLSVMMSRFLQAYYESLLK